MPSASGAASAIAASRTGSTAPLATQVPVVASSITRAVRAPNPARRTDLRCVLSMLTPHRAIAPSASCAREVLVKSPGGLARPLDDGHKGLRAPRKRGQPQTREVPQAKGRKRQEKSEKDAESDARRAAAGRNTAGGGCR